MKKEYINEFIEPLRIVMENIINGLRKVLKEISKFFNKYFEKEKEKQKESSKIKSYRKHENNLYKGPCLIKRKNYNLRKI